MENKIQLSEEEVRILRFILACDGYVNFPYMLRRLYHTQATPTRNKNEYYKLYMRLDRKITKLEQKGLVAVHIGTDGLKWIAITESGIDLIMRVQNSNHVKHSEQDKVFIPKRARPERIEAIKYCLERKQLTYSDYESLLSYYEIYLEWIDDRYIVLRRTEDAPPDVPPFLLIRYKTRFNDPSRILENVEKYEKIFENAGKAYKKAVFLTLTTDPKRHKSIYHSWKFFSKNFNRFMSWLRKKLGFRPPYVAVYEFTKSGLMHVHVIFFGLSYLAHKYTITEAWKRTGQGEITYIYALKNEKGKFVWSRGKPKDCKSSKTAEDYLKKYLMKGMNNPKALVFYWVSNKRFFTYSRSLLIGEKKVVVSTGFFEFFGTWKYMLIPFVVFERIKEWEEGEEEYYIYNHSRRRFNEVEEAMLSTSLWKDDNILDAIKKKTLDFLFR